MPIDVYLMLLLNTLPRTVLIAANGLHLTPIQCDGMTDSHRVLLAVLGAGACISQPEVADLYTQAFGESPLWVQQWRAKFPSLPPRHPLPHPSPSL